MNMNEQTKGEWWAPNPFVQNEPDKLPDTELVIHPAPSLAVANDCYPTEAAAWQAIKGYLTAGLAQAQKNIADNAGLQPYQGLAETLEKERRHIAYAERILLLCESKLKGKKT
jgi:hypothetical protein